MHCLRGSLKCDRVRRRECRKGHRGFGGMMLFVPFYGKTLEALRCLQTDV